MLSRLYTQHWPPSLGGTLRYRPSLSTMQLRTFRSSQVFKTNQSDLTPKVIETTEQTALLYLDNIFPLRMNSFDFRQFVFRNTDRSLENVANRCIPTENLPYNFKLLDIIGRNKDGGAIIKFGYQSGDEQKMEAAKEIVSKVNIFLEGKRTLAPFNFRPVRSFLVKGHPFLEDMVRRYPSLRLRVEFQGEPVSVEKLYKHLRQYGKIYDIALYPNPAAGKDPARYAIVQFTRIRAATSARNCLHGHLIGDTRLNILYERQMHTNAVKDWLMNHPRITIPTLAATAAGITYAIFDPLREFFVISRITQRFNPEEYSFYRWLRRETWARLVPYQDSDRNMWNDDPVHLQKLKSWFREKPDSFVIVNGPSGSGKSELVKAALDDRRNKVMIDCEELVNSRNKSEMTKALAKQVGYFPVFTWVASLSNLIETLVTATTGQHTGLSTTPESQNKGILEVVGIALADIAPMERAEYERKRHEKDTFTKKLTRWMERHFGTTEEIELAEKEENEEDDYDSRAHIPVVFIDNFMKDASKNTVLWEDLAEWAALLVKNELAHVVFVSSNVATGKILAKALPGKSFSTVNLLDAPPEVSMEFLTRNLGEEKITPELYDIVDALGGRLNELELLVQKLKLDIPPQVAFDDIVQRNVIEIRKYGFGEMVDDEYDVNLDWSVIQFWQIVKLLTKANSINYDELKWSDYFDGKDKPIRAMEHSELISILHHDGRPNSIRPGKPVYYTVFKRLLEDKVFAASMEIETHTYLKKTAEDKLTKLQQQIIELSQVYNGKPPREIDQRIRYLLTKVKTLQAKIEDCEKSIKENMTIVTTTWSDTQSE
ncbi:RNA12 protein-domain-containing protein [Halteromyces radiatus]|uniref:RNA12 protein-domain-containing protein n=1 Tax=Halteromyces radiatus TaxID=101107 RepID=UPI00221EC81D|nr:RNA12 protein-domain-containing protein [Halteromyces radiatus]KAI8081771.1 RNA12 protein-domain-containing protein [Halteromyces radiatus]